MPSKRARELLSELLEQDFKVPPGHGCLHSYDAMLSGGLDVLRVQGRLDFTTLEETPGGKWLTHQIEAAHEGGQPFDRQDWRFLWDEASRAYTQGLSGEVSAFVDWNRPEGTFQRIECAEVLKNENITAVNGIPQEELKDRFLHGIEVDSPGMSRVFVQSGELAESLNAERTWKEASFGKDELREASQSESLAERVLENLRQQEEQLSLNQEQDNDWEL